MNCQEIAKSLRELAAKIESEIPKNSEPMTEIVDKVHEKKPGQVHVSNLRPRRTDRRNRNMEG